MKFDQFLKQASKKIGSRLAFDMMRNIRIAIIEEILVTKGIISREEIELKVEQYFDKAAKDVSEMDSLTE